jgi:hypothetical protein
LVQFSKNDVSSSPSFGDYFPTANFRSWLGDQKSPAQTSRTIFLAVSRLDKSRRVAITAILIPTNFRSRAVATFTRKISFDVFAFDVVADDSWNFSFSVTFDAGFFQEHGLLFLKQFFDVIHEVLCLP